MVQGPGGGGGAGKLSAGDATGVWALGVALVTVAVALLGPVCGALSDRREKKKIFFRTSVFLGVGGCILNGFATGWLLFLVLFLLGKVAYSCSLTFYDSMLNDITTQERMDEVSSYGYAWGYLGSCIPFLAALVFYVLGPDMAGLLPGFVSRMRALPSPPCGGCWSPSPCCGTTGRRTTPSPSPTPWRRPFGRSAGP